MRRFLALALIAAIAGIPEITIAAPDIVPFDSTSDSYTGFQDPSSVLNFATGNTDGSGAGLDSAAATAGCSSGSQGGSLAGQLGGFLNSALNGALNGALGSLSGGKSGPGSGEAQAKQIIQNAQGPAAQALTGAAAALDDAIHLKADGIFNNPKSATPALLFSIPDTALTQTIASERIALEQTLQSAALIPKKPISDASFTQMTAEAQAVQTFLANVAQAVGDALIAQTAGASAIQNYQAALTAANAEVSAALTSLVTAKTAYDGALAQAQSVQQQSSSRSGGYGGGGLSDLGPINVNLANGRIGIGGLGSFSLNGGGGSGILGGLQSVLNGGSITSLINGHNLGNFVSILSGGSTAGNLIGSLLNTQQGSQMVSGILGSLGLGGGIGDALGKAGGLLGLAGGALGALPIPLLAAVPVSNTTIEGNTTQIKTDTTDVRQKTDTLEHVVCVTKPLIAQAASDFAGKVAQAGINQSLTGDGGGTIWPQNISQDLVTLGDTVQQNNVNSVIPQLMSGQSVSQYTQYVQQRMVADRDAATNPQSQFNSCPKIDIEECLRHTNKCGPDYATQMQNLTAIFHNGCTPNQLASKAEAIEQADEAGRSQDLTQYLTYTNGLTPKTTCDDPAGSNVPYKLCKSGYKVVTPPPVQTSSVVQAYELNTEKQAHATDIGQFANDALAMIASRVLTSLTGAIGLTQPSASGNGSYLQQAVNGTSGQTIASAQSAVRLDVETSIGIEAEYQSLLNDTVDNLQSAKDAESAVQSCYVALSASGTGRINSITALGRANDASTTISSTLQPEIDRNAVTISTSETLLAQLNLLDNQVQAAQTITQVNAAENAYQALVSAGALHNINDLNFMQSDHDASKFTLDAMTADATTALAACKSGG